MTNGVDRNPFAEECALRKLAVAYARGADRRDPELLYTVFTEDAVIEGPGFRMEGRAQIVPTMVNMLEQMYASTMHTVLNQTVTIEGDTAEGETYCLAHHIGKQAADGSQTKLDWAIRYQDRFVRTDGRWRFARRQLIVDWTETTKVEMIGG